MRNSNSSKRMKVAARLMVTLDRKTKFSQYKYRILMLYRTWRIRIWMYERTCKRARWRVKIRIWRIDWKMLLKTLLVERQRSNNTFVSWWDSINNQENMMKAHSKRVNEICDTTKEMCDKLLMKWSSMWMSLALWDSRDGAVWGLSPVKNRKATSSSSSSWLW